jgi:hypothetical protein
VTCPVAFCTSYYCDTDPEPVMLIGLFLSPLSLYTDCWFQCPSNPLPSSIKKKKKNLDEFYARLDAQTDMEIYIGLRLVVLDLVNHPSPVNFFFDMSTKGRGEGFELVTSIRRDSQRLNYLWRPIQSKLAPYSGHPQNYLYNFLLYDLCPYT